jgi:hypothetical protein
MHPKIKLRPEGETAPGNPLEPLLVHDKTNRTGAASAASRRPVRPVQPASGGANHARHHVSRQTQA